MTRGVSRARAALSVEERNVSRLFVIVFLTMVVPALTGAIIFTALSRAGYMTLGFCIASMISFAGGQAFQRFGKLTS